MRLKFQRYFILVATLVLWSFLTPVVAQTSADNVIIDMAQAYRKADRRSLEALLPRAKGHLLEPWAAYWNYSTQLNELSTPELQNFFTTYAGTYQEDRLRNDYLLLLGRRRDWGQFEKFYPEFRMRDDKQLECYHLAAQYSLHRVIVKDAIEDAWMQLRDSDDGCTYAFSQQLKTGQLPSLLAWQKARLAMEWGKPKLVRSSIDLLDPDWGKTATAIYESPQKFLDGRLLALRPRTRELVTLAIVRLATLEVQAAREEMDKIRWRTQLDEEEKSWIWSVIAKQAGLKGSDQALADFTKAKTHEMVDEHLFWKARVALKAKAYPMVLEAIQAMSASTRTEPVWIYWRAKALQATRPQDTEAVQTLLKSIAQPVGFYEMLAHEELGRSLQFTPLPPLDANDINQAKQNPGLQRALAAIALGLRNEGVREWNYTTNLHDKGGLKDAQLRAAAQLACDAQIWDRCINTSDKSKNIIDWAQRYPMPSFNAVASRCQAIQLDTAYAYGIMRQESRFISVARSGVGATGLMQVMPATAKWTAKKIGMTDYTASQLADPTVNIALGTAYLQLVLNDFEGHQAMAAAAYNAGPGNVRKWRDVAEMDGAVWVENIPFHETRDYVKKVLSNTVVYAGLMSGQAQSLKAKLTPVGQARPEAPIDSSLP
jgi:soluble lytic murein transglycosylase